MKLKKRKVSKHQVSKTILPAGWPPRWADLATAPPHLTEENRSHFCRQWEISTGLTTAVVTFVSSVACPVQGRVTSLVQPVYTNLVLDAFPQPAQITCSPGKKRVRPPLTPQIGMVVGLGVNKCAITDLSIDVTPRLAASCSGLSIDSACSATITKQII